MYTRLQEIKQTKNIDILILGSSHAFRGIDTRIINSYGFTAFNLGSSSQTPIQTKLLLKRYLDQLNPKLIIYDVYPHFFTTDGVESALNIIACDKNDTYSLEMARTINHLKIYNTLFYAYFRDLFDLNSRFFVEPITNGSDTYIPGGYVERETTKFSERTIQPKGFDPDQKQLQAFNDIVSLLNDKNIQLVLVNAPITSELYNSLTNFPEFDSEISKYGTYYNFSQSFHLSDSLHFYDIDHLNQSGVEIYTNNLMNILKEDGYLL